MGVAHDTRECLRKVLEAYAAERGTTPDVIIDNWRAEADDDFTPFTYDECQLMDELVR